MFENDFYESDLNTYKSGSSKDITLSNISEGLHTLNFKVWDVYNNSNDRLSFVVSSSEGDGIRAYFKIT